MCRLKDKEKKSENKKKNGAQFPNAELPALGSEQGADTQKPKRRRAGSRAEGADRLREKERHSHGTNGPIAV